MILITGASGFVGGSILQLNKNTVACPSLRNASEDEVRRIVLESGADTVIHTAAISDIGACEKDPEASYRANVLLPIYLARAAKNIKLVCFSSDQVYGGSDFAGPYTEDMEAPENLYARHKLEMEGRVLDINPDAIMLRAEWMYGYYLKKPNFFMNLLNAKSSVAFSSSQYRGITYVKEVAENMHRVIQLPAGVYNFGSETTRSMYEISKNFAELIGKQITVEDAPARHNLWMCCEKARKHGVVFSTVENGLKRCAEDCGIHLRQEILL